MKLTSKSFLFITSPVSGFLGSNESGTISNCYSTGDVSASSSSSHAYACAGGIVGENFGVVIFIFG